MLITAYSVDDGNKFQFKKDYEAYAK